MSFQTAAFNQPSPGVDGARASSNPTATVDAGPGGFVADLIKGLVTGQFCWMDATATILSNNCPLGVPSVPVGFVANEQQAFITQFLANASRTIPPGQMATAFQRGDFWDIATYAPAVVGNKCFANMFTGSMTPGAAGAFLTYPAGVAASVTATCATNVMTVTAVASGTLAVGQLVTGLGYPVNTRILSLGTGTGGTGTYNLSTTPGTLGSGTVTTIPADSIGGATGQASFATNVMTVTSVTNGVFVVGQLITSAGVAAGTYISSLGTGTGGTGTYNLSTTPGTISAQAVTASAWIETPWYCNSAAQQGELVKIGVRN